jgi:hypothetical protein
MSSLNPHPDSLPNDIKGLVDYPPSMLWLWCLLGVVVIILCVWLIRWVRTKRKKQEPLKLTEKDRLRLLEEAIARLGVPNPFTQQSAKDFFFHLDMSLREFIEARLGVFVTNMTLQETIAALSASEAVSQSTCQEIKTFLQRCEQIKFADAMTNEEEARDFICKIKTLVVDIKTFKEKFLESSS